MGKLPTPLFFTIWVCFFRGSKIWVSHQKRYIFTNTWILTGESISDEAQRGWWLVLDVFCTLHRVPICVWNLVGIETGRETQSDWSAVYFYFYNFLLALPWSDLKQGRLFLDFKGSTHKQGPYCGSWGRNNRGDLRRSNPYVMPQHVDCW